MPEDAYGPRESKLNLCCFHYAPIDRDILLHSSFISKELFHRSFPYLFPDMVRTWSSSSLLSSSLLVQLNRVVKKMAGRISTPPPKYE